MITKEPSLPTKEPSPYFYLFFDAFLTYLVLPRYTALFARTRLLIVVIASTWGEHSRLTTKLDVMPTKTAANARRMIKAQAANACNVGL